MAGWDAVRKAVWADSLLQQRLASIGQSEPFAAALSAVAAELGLTVGPEETLARLRPDPLGLERFAASPPDGHAPPTGLWLPVEIRAEAGEPQVHWLYFGRTRLSEPFYSDSVRKAQRLPFNRLFRYRQGLADFIAQAEAAPPPDGFVFHMSRCGSTLLSQMVAALQDALVVSEAPPLDSILQIYSGDGDTAVRALRAMVAALTRRRLGESTCILKLDAWHTLSLPLFRRAFPHVPWVFLYRDPVEVMVSQVKVRGIQTVPSYVPPALYGLETSVPDEEYCAQVLAAICRAVLEHHALGGGRLVNYCELPGAAETAILPHFNIRIDGEARAAMRQAARMDAKAPGQIFSADSRQKQQEATPRLRDLTERHLRPVYRALEELRNAQR